MEYYFMEKDAVIKKTDSCKTGLTKGEAENRLTKYGKNKLKEEKKDSLLKRFLTQLSDPMIIILIFAALISGITSYYSGESFADVIIIMLVVIINAILGVYQESKAEKAIEALQKMSASKSKVIRDGKITEVKSEDLVLGDIIILEAGNAVPADARIIECASLKSEEAPLTGESVPVDKTNETIKDNGNEISLGDRYNMVYMGSTIVYGRGKAVVTNTGMDTQMGKIADALTNAKEGLTPLQIKLSQLSKILTFLVLGICVIIFGVGIIKEGQITPNTLLDTFMVAVSLAVAAIPEGLAAVVTIVLSIGVTNMSKKNAVIRKLTAVETLGCAQIICSDKTGTLTQNKMTVVDNYCENQIELAKCMTMCNNAIFDTEINTAKGEPTECALVNWAEKMNIKKSELNITLKRINELPFDSTRKMMSTFHNYENGRFVEYVKGAPDEVLKKCTHYLKDGKIIPLDANEKEKIINSNKEMGERALRVLMGAMRIFDKMPVKIDSKNCEADLCFLGLVGMIDPVRPEVKDAIDECLKASIRPIMITGDHIITASAIGKELGILKEGYKAVSGADLNKMDDKEFESKFQNISVYARVAPEHKTRIVNAWKNAGYVTAMTGDGVNDAPSIKSADIGIGMGITGTDVTKNVSDMVLSDDNFATIVGAVKEGRRIYANIRKSIQFLLGSNMSEVLSIFIATMLGFIILKPVHLLWINLITDCFPALALGMEAAERNIMKNPPRNSKESLFANGMGFDIAYQGIAVTLLTVFAYFLGHYIEAGVWEITNSADGTTMAFLTMSMAEIFHSYNMRSQRGTIFTLETTNRFLDFAALASLVLTTAVIYVPFLSKAFGFTHIRLSEYFVALGLAVCIIPIVEVVKLIQRKYFS